jgi:hypothetical protein
LTPCCRLSIAEGYLFFRARFPPGKNSNKIGNIASVKIWPKGAVGAFLAVGGLTTIPIVTGVAWETTLCREHGACGSTENVVHQLVPRTLKLTPVPASQRTALVGSCRRHCNHRKRSSREGHQLLPASTQRSPSDILTCTHSENSDYDAYPFPDSFGPHD